MTPTRNQVLAQTLRSEIEKLRRVRAEVGAHHANFGDHVTAPPILELRGIASVLTDLYQGAENAFQRIAKTIEESLPGGPEWHRKLLDQMSQPMPQRRPAVIRAETREALEPFRRFRHLARHRYGFEVEWEDDIHPLLAVAQQTAALLIDDLETFRAFLDQINEDEA